MVPGVTLLGNVTKLVCGQQVVDGNIWKPCCYTIPFRFTASSSSSFLMFLFLLLQVLLLLSLLISHGPPPRVRIKLPWGHLSMVGGLAEGN